VKKGEKIEQPSPGGASSKSIRSGAWPQLFTSFAQIFSFRLVCYDSHITVVVNKSKNARWLGVIRQTFNISKRKFWSSAFIPTRRI